MKRLRQYIYGPTHIQGRVTFTEKLRSLLPIHSYPCLTINIVSNHLDQFDLPGLAHFKTAVLNFGSKCWEVFRQVETVKFPQIWHLRLKKYAIKLNYINIFGGGSGGGRSRGIWIHLWFDDKDELVRTLEKPFARLCDDTLWDVISTRRWWLKCRLWQRLHGEARPRTHSAPQGTGISELFFFCYCLQYMHKKKPMLFIKTMILENDIGLTKRFYVFLTNHKKHIFLISVK